jgi:hypothetical protein
MRVPATVQPSCSRLPEIWFAVLGSFLSTDLLRYFVIEFGSTAGVGGGPRSNQCRRTDHLASAPEIWQ